MAKTPQVKSLADEICAPAEPIRIVSWFSRLSKEHQDIALEVRRRLREGESIVPKLLLARRLKEKLGVTVDDETICRWLRQ